MSTRSEDTLGALSDDELRVIDAYCRAANYLSVGQIYLLDNPLLREPIQPEDVKPRLLGHRARHPASTSLTSISTGRSGPASSTRSTLLAPATAAMAWLRKPTSRAPTARSTRMSGVTSRAA
jgi:XFP N-terminal domain